MKELQITYTNSKDTLRSVKTFGIMRLYREEKGTYYLLLWRTNGNVAVRVLTEKELEKTLNHIVEEGIDKVFKIYKITAERIAIIKQRKLIPATPFFSLF